MKRHPYRSVEVPLSEESARPQTPRRSAALGSRLTHSAKCGNLADATLSSTLHGKRQEFASEDILAQHSVEYVTDGRPRHYRGVPRFLRGHPRLVPDRQVVAADVPKDALQSARGMPSQITITGGQASNESHGFLGLPDQVPRNRPSTPLSLGSR